MVFVIGSGVTTKFASVGTSSVAKDITGVTQANQQVRVMAKTNDAVVKFGNSGSVTASNTYTGDDLPVGNYVVLAGAVEVFTVPADTTHMAVICEDGATTDGTVWAVVGYGE